MKLGNKLQLFALSILVAMTISVLVAGSFFVDRLAHALYDQILKTELEVMRVAILDSYKNSGELAASKAASNIQDNLKNEPLGLKTGHAYVIEAPDKVIFHPEYQFGEQFKRAEIEKMFQQREGRVEYENEGARRIAVFTTIEPIDWMAFLSIDIDEIHRKEGEYLRTIIFIAIAVVIISMLLTNLFIKRFVQRLKAVQDCIDKVDSGDKEACTISNVIDDEVGSLQQGIATMHATLTARINDPEWAKKALNEQQIKFRTIADYTYDWEYWLGPEKELLYITPSCERITGYSSGEFEANPDLIYQIVHPEDSSIINDHIRDYRKLEDTLVEFRIVHRDGSTRWISHGCQAVYGPDNEYLGRRVSNRDVTNRKRAERELARNEQIFRTLVENSPDNIARYDLELRRVYLNPALQKQFMIPVEKAIGTTSKVSSPLIDPERYMGNIKKVITTGQECSDEISYRNPQGEVCWASTRFAPETDVDGNVESVLVISNDITEQKLAEKERQEYLGFLESLDRINKVMQVEGDIESILNHTLDVVLELFNCDRAYLEYPCDPNAISEWQVPIERCMPDYPSPLSPGDSLPYHPHFADSMRAMLRSDEPLQLGSHAEITIPDEIIKGVGVKSILAMALFPKVDRPWQFGIHKCSCDRVWTDQEVRLFEEIGHRLTDRLNSLLVTRNLQESEGRYHKFFENSPLPIREEDFSAVKAYLGELRSEYNDDLLSYLTAHPGVLEKCAHLLRVTDVNRTAILFHEAKSKEDLLGNFPHIFSPNSMRDFSKVLVALMQGKTSFYQEAEITTLVGRKQNVIGYFSVTPGYEESLERVLVSLVDITVRKQYEEQMRLATSVFANSQESIFISDADNRIIDINPAFTRTTGYTLEEVLGEDPKLLSSGRHNSEFYSEMWESITKNGEWKGEIWNKRKSGEEYPELLSIVAVKNDKDELQHYVGAFTDITMLKQHEDELNHIAHYDMLTSVPNRRLLNDRMEQAIANAKRRKRNLAVCYLDLDGFKPINDEYGHEAGDLVLIKVAKRLQRMLRAADTIARLGGDEFVLLWNDVGNKADCINALERVLNTISEPILLEDDEVSISASIGVTLYPDDYVDADSLLRHADHAMYSAKQLGKNRYQMFDTRLERQITARADFLNKVERALHEEQFELHYQPKVDYFANAVEGVEALIRWNDPILGLVGPKEFLPLIENDNLAYDLGRWVINQAVQQAKIWDDMGIGLSISVNIFPRHLKYRTFVDDLRKAINSYWPEMPKNRLQMEIVESSALEDLDLIEEVINECKQMGVRFSLDDFGTGYSSLVYLRRLTIDELKIDQSFVRDMLNDSNDQAIVISVIGLGNAFGLRVVAEGVETTQHAWQLLDLGCKVMQGFALGRPMPATELEKWYAGFLTTGVKMYK